MSGSNSLLDSIAHPTVMAPDLYKSYGQGQQIAEQINRNRLFQSRQAAGNAFLNSIKPDGTQDQPALNLGLKNDPDTALSALEVSQQGQTLSSDEFALHMKRLTGVNAAAMALTAQYPQGVPQDAVNAEIDRVGPVYGMTPAQMVQAKGSFGADPAANSRTIIRNGIANLTAQDALHASRPGAITTDDGQVIAGANAAPAAADNPGAITVPPGQGVQKQTSPETNAAQSETYIENPKAPGTYLKVLTPRSALPGASGVAPGTSPLGTGRPATGSPLLNPNAPPPPATPAPATTAPLAAPPPGANETVAADVGRFKQDQFAIPQGQQSVQSLQKAQMALEASNTGRSSEGVHNMLATMQTLHIPTFGLADDVGSYDLAHKYLMDYARKSGAAAHSDLQLQTSEGANASTGINQQAALDVVHTNIGRERQAIAQNMEAEQTGVNYGAHAAKFANATDPRGFAIDAYKPADLNPNDPKSMVGKMTDAERAKFYKSAGIAQRLKLINPTAP